MNTDQLLNFQLDILQSPFEIGHLHSPDNLLRVRSRWNRHRSRFGHRRRHIDLQTWSQCTGVQTISDPRSIGNVSEHEGSLQRVWPASLPQIKESDSARSRERSHKNILATNSFITKTRVCTQTTEASQLYILIRIKKVQSSACSPHSFSISIAPSTLVASSSYSNLSFTLHLPAVHLLCTFLASQSCPASRQHRSRSATALRALPAAFGTPIVRVLNRASAKGSDREAARVAWAFQSLHINHYAGKQVPLVSLVDMRNSQNQNTHPSLFRLSTRPLGNRSGNESSWKLSFR